MNFFDKVIAAINPTAGLERARAREFLRRLDTKGFRREGARSGTNRRPTDTILDHPDSGANHTDRLQCMREARGLEENCPFTKSMLRKIRISAVGRIQYRSRSKSKAARVAINEYVERWMRNADLCRRHHFRTMAGLAATSMVRDGDIGFIVTDVDQTPNDRALKQSPVRLQAIEGDRIGGVYNSTNYPSGKPFRKLAKGHQNFSGVIVDEMGVPLRYQIFNRSKDGSTMTPAMEVPAENFIHLFDPTRLDSYRGVSAFDAALNDIKDAAELLGLEKIALKYLCSKSGLVTNTTGEVDSDVLLDTSHDDYNADASRLKEVKPGAIEYLQEGQSFTPLDFDRPTNTFSGFLDTLMKRGGLTVNLPFGFTYSWAGQGTAVRMEAAQAAREIEQIQLILEERLLDPVVQRVIARGIQLGDIPAVPDFDAGEWRYPAKITADVGRESKAMIEENMSGLISKTQIAADRGEDHDLIREFLKTEQLEIIEDAKELVAASGGEIDLKTAIFMLEKRQPNAPQEAPEPKGPAGSDAED